MIAELISKLNGDDKAIAHQITDCLLELDYIPQRQKGNNALDFKNNKLNAGKDTRLLIPLKFYANKPYSGKFKEGLKEGAASILLTREQNI